MQPQCDRASKNHDQLRIAYVNVRGLSKPTLDIAEGWMKNKKFDILFLAETWFSNEFTYLASPFYTIQSTRPPKNPKSSRPTCGILVLCRRDLHPHISTEFTIHSVTIRINQTIISGVYLPPSLSSTDFKQTLENLPASTILLGDFNCIISSADARTSSLKSFCAERNLHHVSPLEARLDHIWVTERSHAHTPSFTPKTHLDGILSDHGLISIMIPIQGSNISNNTTAPTKRFFLKHLNDETKCDQLHARYEQFSPLINDTITEAINGTRGKSWSKISQWVDTVDEIWNLAIKQSCEEILGTYHVDEVKQWEDKSFERLAKSNSMSSSIRLWKRAQRGRQTRITSSSDKSSPLVEGIELFKSVYSDPSCTMSLRNETLPHTIAPDIDLTSSMTMQQLRKAIRKYPKHKSCGPDGLHARIFVAMTDSDIFMHHFATICQFYVNVCCTPSSWNISNTPLLPKKNGDVCLVTETRPVSLTNMARRYFESILLRHISKHRSFSLHKNQAGFRRGYSTISHLLVAHETCRLPRPRRHSIAIYLDLTKAFDRVRHLPLMDYLRQRGCPESIRMLLYHLMMHDCRSHIIVNGARSEAIERTRGVFQGSIIAPLLFNIAMDSLAQKLDQIEVRDTFPSFLLFADDIRLSAHLSNSDTLHSYLQVCELWAEEFGLTFGLQKCGVVGDTSETFSIHNEEIPHVEFYKYLGVELNKDGIIWPLFQNRIYKKTEATLGLMYKCATQDWGQATRLALIKTYVLSQLQYGMGLLAHQRQLASRLQIPSGVDATPMERLHLDCLKFVFGYATPTPLLESMSNIWHPEDMLTLAKASTTRHLNSLAIANPCLQMRKNIQATSEFFLIYTRRSFLTQCFSDKNYDEWKKNSDAAKVVNPDSSPIGLKSFLSKQFETSRCKRSLLVGYIASECRTAHGRIDMTLFIKDPSIRNNALLWRTNRLFINRYCEICSRTISRTHVDHCLGLQELLETDQILFTHFQKERSQRRKLHGIHDNFTFLDFLLNKQEFDKFNSILKLLLENSSR